jgi:hypothetical protein
MMNNLAAPSGRAAQTFTGTGVSVSSAQKQFGTFSASEFSSSNRFTTTGHTDSDFTLEGWARFSSQSTSYRSVFGSFNLGSGLGLYNNNIMTLASDTGNTDFLISNIALNTWYHIAITRSGTTCKLYVNGTQRGGNQTLSGAMFSTLIIGASNLGQNMDGFIDEVRLSKGLRYTGNFTSPTSAFVNNADTILLCHCEVAPFVDDNS